MKAGNGRHFEQAYNAQAAVDVEGSYLILGRRVTNNPNDKKELVPTVESVAAENRIVSDVSADTGEWNIVTLAYNFKRQFNMTGESVLSYNGVSKAVNA